MKTRTELHFGNRVIRCYAQRPANLMQLFEAVHAEHAGALALITASERLDYAALRSRSRKLATGLMKAGLQAGDRLVLVVGNRIEYMTFALAAWQLGAIIVPLNPRNARDEIAFVINQCTARAVVFDSMLADRIPLPAQAPSATLRVALDEPVAGFLTLDALVAHAEHDRVHQAAEEDVAALLYTSGTTGRPKGAMLTHFNLLHSIRHFEEALHFRRGERSIMAVPISHVTGLVAIWLAMLGVGGSVVLMKEFKAADYLATVQREQVTYTIAVPAMYNLMLRVPQAELFDLSSMRLGGFGGAPMPEPTIEALSALWPQLTLSNTYGATETSSPTAIMPPGEQRAHLDSVGKVVPCGDIRVMDENGREVAPGETGELWIAGPMIVPGYWDNPEATAREFAGGYWKSGDIGSVDAQGYVRIFDRRKDMINRGGYKIYGAEVESALLAHPAVLEAAVVASPDPVLGERAHAYIVSSAPVDAAALRAHCAEKLADYKIPDLFTFRTEALPRNPNGKVLKRMLRG